MLGHTMADILFVVVVVGMVPGMGLALALALAWAVVVDNKVMGKSSYSGGYRLVGIEVEVGQGLQDIRVHRQVP